ncbi:MAG: methyltransferase [Pseudomonadota bacterium]
MLDDSPTQDATVDWTAYARTYDMLLDHNPAYQDLIERFDRFVVARCPETPFRAVDVGGGTGNFAERLLARRPNANLTLVEPDAGMRARATEKFARYGDRVSFIAESCEDHQPSPDYDLVISTHAIYTVSDQRAALRKLFDLGRPGAQLFLIDFGGRMNVRDWSFYLVTRLLMRVGPIETVRLIRNSGEIAKQNGHVREMQDAGRYWLHGKDEFVAEVVATGWTVDAAYSVYRGYSTLVTGRKP